MPLDFPSNPIDGQIYDNYYWDSAAGVWNSLGNYAVPNLLSNATFTSSGSSIVPVTVKGAASQAANLQEWKNSSNTTLASISASGGLTLNNALTVGNGGTGATSFTAGNYLKGNGTSAITTQAGILNTDLPAGTVIKMQYYTDSSVSNGTNTSYADVNANLRLNFTPLRTNSELYVIASMSWLNELTHTQQLRMLRGGVVSGLADINIATALGSGWNMYQGSFQWQDTLAHTAGTQVTFSFQTRVNSGNWYYNYNTALGPGRSMYSIWEIAT